VVLLPDVRPLGPRSRIRFHLGTQDVGGRLVGGADALRPGSPSAVRVILDEPVVARGGDRFVIRSGSPSATVAGGIVSDPLPGHRRLKMWPEVGATPVARLVMMARDAGVRGVPVASVPVRIGMRPADVDGLVRDASAQVDRIDGDVYDRDTTRTMADRLLARIDAHHAAAPLDDGVSQQELRATVAGGSRLADALIRRLEAAGTIAVDHGLVRRAAWVARPSSKQRQELDRLAAVLRAAGREPPSVSELARGAVDQSVADVASLLRLMDRRELVQQVEPDRFYSVEALRAMVDALRVGMQPGKEYGPAELRALLGVSRKYLIPLLEYYDRVGVTERRHQGRIVRPVRPADVGPASRGIDRSAG